MIAGGTGCRPAPCFAAAMFMRYGCEERRRFGLGSGVNEDPGDPANAKPKARQGKAGGGRARKAPHEAAFDIWLDRNLHALFDGVAQEPIPPDLIALVARDRKA